MSFHPKGHLIATGSSDHYARVWDWHTGQLATSLLWHNGILNVVEFDNSGDRLLTAGNDGVARLWNLSNRLSSATVRSRTHNQRIAGLAPKLGLYLAKGADNSVSIASLLDPARDSGPLLHEGTILSARFSPDESLLLTTSRDGMAHLWRSSDGTEATPAMKHGHAVSIGAFDAGGRLVATGTLDGLIRVWSTADGSLIADLPSQALPVTSIAFLRDPDKVLASYGRNSNLRSSNSDGKTLLWSIRAVSPLRRFEHGGSVRWAAASHDGRSVLSVGDGNVGRIWEAANGSQVGSSLSHESMVIFGTFSPDDSCVVTTSWDQTARLWDSKSGNQIGLTMRHRGTVLHAAFSPDGSLVATASNDGAVRVWDANTGFPVSMPLLHNDRAFWVAFGTDDHQVYSASQGCSIREDRLTPALGTVNELRDLATLLTSRRLMPNGEIVAVAENVLKRTWDEFSTRPGKLEDRHRLPTADPSTP